jgi:predicted transcriptional regulator
MAEKQLTDLDKKLQDIASKNWQQFVDLIGNDAIIAAKICMLRQEQRTYGEISVKLGITEKRARYWCGECDVKN